MRKLYIEIAILVAVGAVVSIAFSQLLYPLMGLPSSGPIPVRTIILVLVIAYFFSKSGRSWRNYGFGGDQRWWHIALWALAALLAKLLLIQPLSDWLKEALGLPPQNYSFFQHLVGNGWALALWLLIVWVAGGFAEEMVFRGYLMKRIAEEMKSTRLAIALGLVLQAVIFGLGHAYTGWGGAISGTLTALVFGGFVLATRGSLWPVILAHGLWDSLGIFVLYKEGLP